MLKTVYYLEQIPEVVELIKATFAGISGIKEVKPAIRPGNNLVVYIFVDYEAADKCKSDMILPKDAGIKYKDSKMNKTRYPRLWLEEYAAKLKCEEEITKQHPHLFVEWITMLLMPNNTVALVR